MTPPFDSIYSRGFARTAIAVPWVRVADPAYNTDRTLRLAREAAESSALLVVFPELGISAYSNDDLFHQDALLDGVLAGLRRIIDESRSLAPVLVIGAPLRF